MRPYRNISDSELESFDALREWDSQKASSLIAGSSVLWVHSTREKFHRLDSMDSCLIKTITIERVQGDVIKTNFGSYSIVTGKNIYYSCGCKKFCDCYGQLYLLKLPL
ncbi:MAG: hypothetical protein PHW18_11345 [Sulfuricurvum sp.]|uniref:hypothetical protein n=1 Tax=Sulfuricurvum sp. TaxID=2025608 RepID=UPI00262F2AF8|nr:hypothetical protein [Sulfuricurvum sp.]MDD2830158.1 hypothetical protein [Sulfuricurvum sp.]MDD4950402.1 hypothetical protein [Sulfuricurvum sp.]